MTLITVLLILILACLLFGSDNVLGLLAFLVFAGLAIGGVLVVVGIAWWAINAAI